MWLNVPPSLLENFSKRIWTLNNTDSVTCSIFTRAVEQLFFNHVNHAVIYSHF